MVRTVAAPRPARFCEADDDCNNINACQDSLCQNPCFTDNPCPASAECKPFEREALCFCPNGTTGNPWKECESGWSLRFEAPCTEHVHVWFGCGWFSERCQGGFLRCSNACFVFKGEGYEWYECGLEVILSNIVLVRDNLNVF